ncbi:unnamed protein product [Penicillium olsonii]|nr:unnamed protein product [Penicillium olsonii]
MANARKAALTKLPLELLWLISAHLTPADFACLALGNRHLLNSFSTDAFSKFSSVRTGTPTDYERIELLSRISRDIPQYYPCFICLRLHLWRKIQLPSLYSPSINHNISPRDLDNCHLIFELPLASYPSYTHYGFYFVHLQLAMRRFYHGPEFGIPVESLLYTEVGANILEPNSLLIQRDVNNLSGNPQRGVMLTLFSAETRICSTPPGLCMRTQDIAVVARKNAAWIWAGRGYAIMRVCKHINTLNSDFYDILNSQIKRYCSTTDSKAHADQGKCDECNTSWQLEIRTLDESRTSLTLTRWMDLGPGLSTEDVEWKYRLDCVVSTPPRQEPVDSRSRFEKESIQSGFPDALSEEAMYRRNVALLRGNTFQRVMTPVRGGFYILRGDSNTKTDSPGCLIL